MKKEELGEGRTSFRPRLIETLRGYTLHALGKDVTAGLVVGVVALPLAIAFGINSGFSPQAGLWTAVIAGFLISALGGTKTQIGGPTGAFVPILLGLVATYGLEKVALATLMAGVILFIMGAARLGGIIKFIPYPVTMGFTSGIAVVIFTQQIKDIMGLQLVEGETFPGHCFEQWLYYGEHLGLLSWPTLALAAPCVALMFLWPKRLGRRLPASIVVLLLATVVVAVFGIPHEMVATVGSRFGEIRAALPEFRLPPFSFELLRELALPATTIAMLGAIESLLSAVVADSLTDDRHDSNQELMAQGVANIFSPLFGGMAATGAIARTATNIRNGATSPVSGIVHALTLFLIIMVAAPLAGHIPIAALAAILLFVAFNMGEWHLFKRLMKIPRSDAAVFLTTFGLTVFADLTVAVTVGIVLASILFIKRVSELSGVGLVTQEGTGVPDRDFYVSNLPKGVDVFRLQGAFFFGTADKLETAFRRSQQDSKALILVMDQAISIDASGLNALESLHARLKAKGKQLVLCGVQPHVHEILYKSGFLEELGENNIADTLYHAIQRTQGTGAGEKTQLGQRRTE